MTTMDGARASLISFDLICRGQMNSLKRDMLKQFLSPFICRHSKGQDLWCEEYLLEESCHPHKDIQSLHGSYMLKASFSKPTSTAIMHATKSLPTGSAGKTSTTAWRSTTW